MRAKAIDALSNPIRTAGQFADTILTNPYDENLILATEFLGFGGSKLVTVSGRLAYEGLSGTGQSIVGRLGEGLYFDLGRVSLESVPIPVPRNQAGALGFRAIDLAQTYEKQIRGLFPDISFTQRRFTAFPNGPLGGPVNLISDGIADINSVTTAIEAKFIRNFEKSIFNPDGRFGSTTFGGAAQARLVRQALAYSSRFDQVRYYSNSPQFIETYNRIFQRAGVKNLNFFYEPLQNP